MSATALHGISIVGAYNTRQARVLEGQTSRTVMLDAIRGVLADAGLGARDLDGVSVRAGESSAFWVHQLGGRPSWAGSALMGVPALLEAASAIAAGLCEVVLVGDAQAGEYRVHDKTAPWTRPSSEFVECFGLYTAVEFALIARRHMELYGTRPEHLAEVAATIRNNGSINPGAVYFGRGPYLPQDILASPMVADPFHLLDCATTSEGGCAVILAAEHRARDLQSIPVYLLGGGMEKLGQSYTAAPVWDEVGYVGRAAAARAFAQASLLPRDVDVCEFYDPFSFEIIRQFEAYGFCGEGEGGPFVMDGRIGLAGEFPICTDGGTMSCGHAGTMQNLQRMVAAVEQLRGAAGVRQVKDARVAMCSNFGAAAMMTDVILLGQQRP